MAQPGQLRVRVTEVIRETRDARSLVLEPVNERDRFDYRPGQFLTIRVPSTREGGAARCYSLSSSPYLGERAKITVKRTADGYASNWLCDNAVEDLVLDVLPPAGVFTPCSLDRDLLLLAGGSGITPVMSILKSCLHSGTGSVTLVYANRDERSVIFREELAELSESFPGRLTVLHWIEAVQGLPAPAGFRGLVAPYLGRDVFLCGPGPFMDLAASVLTAGGVARARVNVERFTSLTGDPFAVRDAAEDDSSGPLSTVEVELGDAQRTVSWPGHRKLLDVLLEAGVDAPFSCREGACSACACLLLEGEVTLEHNEILDRQDLADGLILACQAFPVTDRLKITYAG